MNVKLKFIEPNKRNRTSRKLSIKQKKSHNLRK